MTGDAISPSSLMRFDVTDDELARIVATRPAGLRRREYIAVLRRFPRLIPEVGGLVRKAAWQALVGSSALTSLVDATKVRRVVPDAAVGAGWYPPHGFVRELEPFLGSAAEVLELGCGSGRVSLLVAPKVRTLIATDMSPTMIDEAAKNLASVTNVQTRVTNGLTLQEFSADAFDVVFAAGMFGYVESSVFLALLDEVARVLRPGGYLVFNSMFTDDDQEAAYLLSKAREAALRGRLSGTNERPYCLAQLEAWFRLTGLKLVSADPAEPDGSSLRRRTIVAQARDGGAPEAS